MYLQIDLTISFSLFLNTWQPSHGLGDSIFQYLSQNPNTRVLHTKRKNTFYILSVSWKQIPEVYVQSNIREYFVTYK